MFSLNKLTPFYTLVLIPLVLLLSSCSERSEYGEKSDYEKLGAACIPSSGEVTPPRVSSVSPTDNSTYTSPETTVAVTFSENMETGSVTTNTSDTTCLGSFQLSSDNFTTCIKMSAAPVASDNDTTFTITPASSLSTVTTFKVKITTSVTDISCNTLGSDNTSIVGFTTSPSGSGTITGSVQMDNGSALSGVSVSDALYGSTVATMTSDSGGDFSQASLPLGMHSFTYSKSGYLGLTMQELLETDGETINLETVRLLPDNCTSGTMSGTISDAVTGDNMSGVNLYYTSGINKHFTWRTGTYFGQTDENGVWSLPNFNYPSSISEGWYTILSNKSGYYKDYHNAEVCGDISNQNNALSSQLDEGEMRIMLKWPITDPVTVVDLDAHLSIPDNDSTGTFHLYYDVNVQECTSICDYYVYGAGDNVTLDFDDDNSTAPPGKETITILSGAATKVRSGIFSYSVHNFTDKGEDTANYKTNLSKSRAKVKVFYNDQGTLVRKRFNVPNDNGTLWRVFTFDSSGSGSGFTRVDNMTYETKSRDVY